MPNTPVRAAAEGMPDVNRRQMLRGLAASSAAATALIAASIPAEPADHPDAALFRLDHEMEEAHARMTKAMKAYNRTEAQCFKAHPPRPAKYEEARMPDDILEMASNMTIGDFRRQNEPEALRAWYEARDKDRAASNAEWEAHRARCDEIDSENGLHDREEAFSARLDELWEIGRRIFETPANTFEGMAIKLRAGDRLDLQSFADDSNTAFLSIAADIKRLASEGGAV